MKNKVTNTLIFSLVCLATYPLCLPLLALEANPTALEKTPKTINDNNLSPTPNNSYPLPSLKPLTPTPPATNTFPQVKEYTIAPGDIISINVFNVADQGGDYPIFLDGTVSIPVIGNFKVQGMTLKQINDLFAREYARYLKRPIVTVTLKYQRALQLAIAGEVNNPGNYTLGLIAGAQPTITTLFAQAGGLTVSADVSQIQLHRVEDGEEKIYTLNFWELLRKGDLKQDVSLQDKDVIIVPTKTVSNSLENRELTDASFGIKYKTAPLITLVGEVQRPGSYAIPLESGEPRLSVAIKLGGGIRERADIRNIQVRRLPRDGEEQTIDVDLWNMLQTGAIEEDILLQDGDTIIIPVAEEIDPTEASALATANFAPDSIVINIIGPVRGAGAKKLAPNSTLNQAILAAGGFDDRRADQSSVELVRMNPNGTVTKREIKVDLTANINEETNPILSNNDVILVDRNGLTVFTENIETLLGPLGRTFSFLNFYNSFGNLFNDFGN